MLQKNYDAYTNTFLKRYLELSNLPENSKNEIIQILNTFIINSNNDLTIYSLETQYCLHLLDAATNNLSIIKNWNNYFIIYETVDNYLKNLNNHHQHKQLKQIYNNVSDKIFYVHLWTNAIFYSLVNAQSLADLEQETEETKKILQQVVNIGAETLFIQHCILYFDKDNILITKILFKKYLFIILNEINEKKCSWMQIIIEKKTNVIPLHEFLKETLDTKIKPSENKITLIKFTLSLTRNFLRKFNISLKAPTIFKHFDDYYTYSIFKLASKPLIKQSSSKQKTIITDSFIIAANHLNNTKFYINNNLLKKITQLAELELEALLKNNQPTIENAETLNDLKILLQNLLKKVYTKKYTRAFFQEKLTFILKEDAEIKSIGDILKNSQNTQMLTKSLFKTNKTEQTLFTLANSVQTLFSKIYMLTNFLAYVEYIEEHKLEYLYFTVYADFRGRLYYNSEATIQSIWCFRYLYTFESYSVPYLDLYPLSSAQEHFWTMIFKPIYTDYIGSKAIVEFFQAIGIIFKGKLTNKEGMLSISDCLLYGFDFFKKFSEQNIEFQKLELKIKAEILYYITAINDIIINNSKQGYYIWKDSTASMAQHGGKILGYKNSALKYLNLANNFHAYDTYTVIINNIHKYLLENYENAEQLIPYLQRNVLKQLIMTSEYGVTYYTAKKRYLTLVEELSTLNDNYKILTDQKLLKLIYNYLHTDAISELFYKTTQAEWWDKTQKEVNKLVKLPDLCYEHTYYKLKTHTVYFDKPDTETRSRSTITFYLSVWELNNQDLEIDTKKTNTAAYVNLVHAYDALYLRNIARECSKHNVPLATIHDGFATPYIYTNWLLQVANYCFWDNHVKVYSHTILL